MPQVTFQEIDLSPTPNQRQVVALDGTEYVLRFNWRERVQAWYVSIYTYPDEDVIVEGRRLRTYMDATEFQAEAGLDGFFGYTGPANPDFDDPEATPFYAYANEST
jgi:hypothetical protein